MRYSYQLRDNAGISEDRLRAVAPSIFADAPHESRSDRYAYISTIETVRALQGQGFIPVVAGQQRTKVAGREDFTKHVIRFQHPDAPKVNELGGLVPEILLVNGHDGSSAYQLRAGLFRFLCENGLAVGTELSSFKVQHTGRNTGDKVIDAAFTVVSETPRLLDAVRDWSGVILKKDAQDALAVGAAALRWDFDAETGSIEAPIDPLNLERAPRWDDKGDSLWLAFNRVQENVMKGGIRGYNANRRRVTSRAVNSVTEDVRFNTALWKLADDIRNNPDVYPGEVFQLPTLKAITDNRKAVAAAKAKKIEVKEAA